MERHGKLMSRWVPTNKSNNSKITSKRKASWSRVGASPDTNSKDTLTAILFTEYLD